MATVGTALTSPETGWRRLDDKDQNISYIGTWINNGTDSKLYKSTGTYSTVAGTEVRFNFTGTCLRLIGALYPNRSTSISVYIDGVNMGSFNQYNASALNYSLDFNAQNLVNKEHCVRIINNASGAYGGIYLIDAIDIASDAYLRPYNENPKQKICTNLNDMTIGDIIPCRYVAYTSGVPGFFSELGYCTASEIPYTGSATSNGLFYFIKVDNGLLIADRVLQNTISWDTLNKARYIEGKIIGDVFSINFDNQFIDSNNYVWSDVGAAIDSNGKFDNCIRIDNNTQCIKSNDGRVNLSSGPWEMSCFVKLTSDPGGDMAALITDNRNYPNRWVWDITSQSIRVVTANNSILWSINTAIPLNQFNHVLCNSDGITARMFVNGKMVGSRTHFNLTFYNNIGIGWNYSGITITSPYYIDDFVVRNICTYASDFTPPTDSHKKLDIKIRSLSGGNSYLGTDNKSNLTDASLGGWPTNNEYDKYIVNSDLGGKITPGDDNIWHYQNWNWSSETPINNVINLANNAQAISSYRTLRGYTGDNKEIKRFDIVTSSYNDSNGGFRPVLEYKETDSSATNLYY